MCSHVNIHPYNSNHEITTRCVFRRDLTRPRRRRAAVRWRPLASCRRCFRLKQVINSRKPLLLSKHLLFTVLIYCRLNKFKVEDTWVSYDFWKPLTTLALTFLGNSSFKSQMSLLRTVNWEPSSNRIWNIKSADLSFLSCTYFCLRKFFFCTTLTPRPNCYSPSTWVRCWFRGRQRRTVDCRSSAPAPVSRQLAWNLR